MEELTLQDVQKNIASKKAFVKGSFQGVHGFVVLWFDFNGYSITTVANHSQGTTGVMSCEESNELFLKTVKNLLEGEYNG